MGIMLVTTCVYEKDRSRVGKEIPQKRIQLRPRSHLRHVVGKRAAQKDAIKDTTSDTYNYMVSASYHLIKRDHCDFFCSKISV